MLRGVVARGAGGVSQSFLAKVCSCYLPLFALDCSSCEEECWGRESPHGGHVELVKAEIL